MVDPGGEGAFSQISVDLLLLLLDLLLYLLFVPGADSIQEVGATVDEVPFVVVDYGLEGTLNIDLVLFALLLLLQLLLRFPALVVKMLPNGSFVTLALN